MRPPVRQPAAGSTAGQGAGCRRSRLPDAEDAVTINSKMHGRPQQGQPVGRVHVRCTPAQGA
jgi:hypothetical protein